MEINKGLKIVLRSIEKQQTKLIEDHCLYICDITVLHNTWYCKSFEVIGMGL